MGEVYRATDINLKRPIAIKVLPEAVATDAERVARFQREAEVLARLNHPNIAQIYGLEKRDGTTALVMELVEGPTLADRIAQGPIPLEEALPIARRIADALEAAHDSGIVHRDLKPANIALTTSDQVKVLDFGLAKALTDGSAAADSNLTNSPTITNPIGVTGVGVLLGTAAYMSPEQARGKPVDKRADIWAFGCVLFEMLTGRRAFDGEDVATTLASVVKEQPNLNVVPRNVRRLIATCLEKDPKARLRDIGDVWSLLDSEADSALLFDGSPSRWRFTVLAWTLAGAATLALAGLAAVHFRETSSEPPVVRSLIAPPENTVFDFDLTVGPVVISPDGRLLTFTARSADGRRQLWIRPLDSLTARPLDGTDGAMFPFWSPDGRWIGLHRAPGRLFRIEVSGGPAVPITEAGFVRGASWGSRDTIIFDSGSSLWTVSAGSGRPVRRPMPDTASGETSH